MEESPKRREGGQPGNTNARKSKRNRVIWHGYLDPATLEKLQQLAASSGLSQGQIIDQSVAQANLKILKTEVNS